MVCPKTLFLLLPHVFDSTCFRFTNPAAPKQLILGNRRCAHRDAVAERMMC